MAAPRPIRLPGPSFGSRPLPVTAVKGMDALRVHGAAYPAVQFRLVSSHRYSHPEASGGLLYLGFDLETCLWECFGDAILDPGSMIARSRWMNQRLSRIRSTASFRICDLTDLKTRSQLKVDLSALKHTDLEIPQAWGQAIQNHPDQIDGLFYPSRFTTGRCLVLFERGGSGATLKSSVIGDLPDLDEADSFLDENKIALV
ncbi:RES family NAD+ phosphorylase [Luteolibacter sp. Populi]|uniref:RES family NAD+ phosphorylase n=1 Tax=Luteolibacter sp. Populi TaxID=3230487 RepID=UPI0034656B7F